MKAILGFIYKSDEYYVVDDGTKIYLGRYQNKEFIQILDSEKSSLKNIIKLLLSDNFDITDLDLQKIKLLQK